MSKGFQTLFIAAAVSMLLLPGCGGRGAGDRGRREVARPRPIVASGWELVDSIRVDLDLDGRPELVVTSRDAEGAAAMLPGRTFDRVEVFRDSSGAWHSLFVDPVGGGTRLSFEDVARIGTVQVLAYFSSGGNDPVASNGLSIYGRRHDGTFGMLFFSEEGDPAVRDLDGDGVGEVLVSGEYWGMMPHADGITYTEIVYAYNGSTWVPSNDLFGPWFDREISTRRAAYRRVLRERPTDEDAHAIALHRAFLEWVFWTAARGDLRAVRAIWNAEQRGLARVLNDDEYDDIDTIVQDILTDPEQDPPPSPVPPRSMTQLHPHITWKPTV